MKTPGPWMEPWGRALKGGGGAFRAGKGDWLRAGIAGAFAAGTRVPGLFLLPALAVSWLTLRRSDGRKGSPWSVLWLLLIPLPPLAFTAYLQARAIVHLPPFHPLSLFLSVKEIEESCWHSRFVMPWEALAMAVRGMVSGGGG